MAWGPASADVWTLLHYNLAQDTDSGVVSRLLTLWGGGDVREAGSPTEGRSDNLPPAEGLEHLIFTLFQLRGLEDPEHVRQAGFLLWL